MILGNYKIVKDGENAAVMLIGENKKTGEKTLKPVAYVRDLLGALEAVQRKMGVDAFDKEPEAKKLLKLLVQQHEELLSIVKSKCKECLK